MQATVASATPVVAWTATTTGGFAEQSAITTGQHTMALDAQGNVYVTGTDKYLNEPNFLTVKYDANGAIQWRAVVNGEANSTDAPAALAVDQSGNVHVTGWSHDGQHQNFLTIQYDTNGVERWRAKASVSDGGDSYATALALDAQGNVYVTGGHLHENATSCLTVKYGPQGAEAWRVVAACDFAPVAVAVDVAGNVVVVTPRQRLKYNAAGGMLWRVDDATFDAAAAAVDKQGGVVVAGTIGGGAATSFVTVRYDAAGVEQWRAQDGTSPANATAVVLDDDGNAHVSGNSNGSYLTIKYAASGAVQWRAAGPSMPGPSNRLSVALALDPARNLYLAAQSLAGSDYQLVAVKYSPGGVEQWRTAKTHSSVGNVNLSVPAVAVDANSNVLVNGTGTAQSGKSQFLTVKYSATGIEQWQASPPGGSKASAALGFDAARSMAVDANNNVYLTGTSLNRHLIVKLSAGGAEQWRVEEPGFGGQSAMIGVDAAGNVYVAKGTSGYVIVKYDTRGVRQWRTDPIEVAGMKGAIPRHLKVDAHGNVHVTGTYVSSVALGEIDLTHVVATVKLDTNGVEQWRAVGVAGSASQSFGTGLDVDAAGNVTVVGVRYQDDVAGYYTTRYDASGHVLWLQAVNGNGAAFDAQSAVAVDASGNAYVTSVGYHVAPGGNPFVNDHLTLKYDAAGVEQWRATEVVNAQGVRAALALDAAGGVAVLRPGFKIVKFDSNGAEQWRTPGGGGGGGNDIASALAVNGQSSVYITGRSFNGHDWDYLTIKYGPTGTEQWRVVHNNLAANDYAFALGLGVDGSVFVGGNSNLGDGPSGITVQKIVEDPVAQTVVEFYNPDLDHYFITADAAEQAAVDSGAVGNWQRTGNSFKAGGTQAVCRFYGNSAFNPGTGAPFGPNSHFYTASTPECESLKDLYAPDARSWKMESYDFLTTPSPGGSCGAGTVPVYRAYNDGFRRGVDSNHRITSNSAAYQETIAKGWIAEGVAMCAPE